MNLVPILVGLCINLIYTPFSENARSVSSDLKSDGHLFEDLFMFPFSLLKGSPACASINLTLGESRLKLISIPRGKCNNCCPVKISKDIQFVLYNKNHPQVGNLISPFDQSGAAIRAGVNPNWKTIIYIHGFSEQSPGESGRAIVDAYLSRAENFNIILLDWGELASFPWYRTAVQNVKLVGQVLRNFLKLFNQTEEIPIQKLHIIGFSLGSHIASVAGKELMDSIRIPRITALDPAFPEFPLRDRTKRLAQNDAEYVDVIHTDAGTFGFPFSIGDADFYPNGGRSQPGCQPNFLVQRKITDQVLACSHERAWRLYAESVRNAQAFPATHCRKWTGQNKECNFTIDAIMGFANERSIGQFYLKTNFESPYRLDVNQQNI